MAHPHIHLFQPSPDAPFRFDREPASDPRPAEDVEREIEEVVGSGVQWIVLGEREATAHPDLVRLVWQVDELGARAKMVSNGVRLAEPGVLEKLRDGGLAQLTLVFYGAEPATHDGLVSQEGALTKALEALELGAPLNRLLITARYVLLRDNHTEVAAFVARARSFAARIELVRLNALTSDRDLLRTHGLPRKAAMTAVQAAWEAARVTHTKLTTQGFGTFPAVPNPRDVPLQPVDLTLLEFLRSNVPVPSTSNGTWATPRDGDLSGLWYAVAGSRTLHELGLQLAAYGCPPMDLPPSMGGFGLDLHPLAAEEELPLRKKDGVPRLLERTFDPIDARPLPAWTGCGEGTKAVVVGAWSSDNILALSTLPSLARALQARGVETSHPSVWASPINPYDNGVRLPDAPSLADGADPDRKGWCYPPGLVEAMANTPARIAHAKKQEAAWLNALDFTGAELVVVPGFEAGLAVYQHPTLSPTARVVIADFHLTTGLAAWQQAYLPEGQRAMDGGWWPDERVLVHAIYPRYVRAYWRSGIPLRQVVWRPYPICADHFSEGPPPTSCHTIFTGGSHQRDWDVLAQAARHLGRADAGRLVIHTPEDVPAPLQNQGEVRLLHFQEAIANSRFVVLPLSADNRRPAGISVVSMALSAGRPVIASATPGMVDHLRHGHDAILVPPGRPKALARAIRRLLDDDDLLARLSAGARRSAAHRSVTAWADLMVDGAPAKAAFTMEDERKGPFYAWPAR